MTIQANGPPRANAIPKSSRKNILDWLRAEKVAWAGRLSEEAFLERTVDLDRLPSTDPRFLSARQDIWQHRVNNFDWDDEWIYSYSPLSLIEGSDDLFGKFLTEMLHPVVRPDSTEARELAAELNDLLREANVELVETAKIGERPVWAIRGIISAGRHTAPYDPTAAAGADEALVRIWGRRSDLRLFLSHVSAHKTIVSALKRHLAMYGISGFVAHVDIEPSLEWQSEIELALSTMQSMAALLTPDFHQSRWTDQEVGVAIGRGVLVLPIQVPETPYGFMGKHQGLRGDLSQPGLLASAIAEILLKRTETATLMREALTVALEESDTPVTLK